MIFGVKNFDVSTFEGLDFDIYIYIYESVT